MNNDHAKIVLSVYRPHGQDADDPFFAEALQQAKNNPAMAAWFKNEHDRPAHRRPRAAVSTNRSASSISSSVGRLKEIPLPIWSVTALTTRFRSTCLSCR